MNSVNTFYCRIVQRILGLNLRHSKTKEPEKYHSIMDVNEILEKERIQKPMIVTGPRISKTEWFIAFQKQLPDHVLFTEVRPDPLISIVEKMVVIYRESDCDAIISIGGGSNMDAAKALGARIARPDKSVEQMQGTYKVRKKTPLSIVIPTTAGTGSECTIAAVITNDQSHRKVSINDPVLCPDYAILDASLTLTLSPSMTASAGMDALTHAVEAYLNTPYHNAGTKSFCQEAVTGIFKYLLQSYKNPYDLAARQAMLEASYKAGLAFTTACVGNVHAIAHSIGGLYHVPHGYANAVILPIVLEDYGKTVEKPLSELARWAGIRPSTPHEEARSLIQMIRYMNRIMGISDHIESMQTADIEKMARWADQEANPLYPVPVIYSVKHFKQVIAKVGKIEV